MNLVYHRSESGDRPKEIQVGITTVYFRKNIIEKQHFCDNETYTTMYVYDEAKLTKDEALQYLSENGARINASLDYISMMTGVNIPNRE